MSVLEIDRLSISFGGIQALRDVSIRAGEWEIVGIIGPNGAGKTTLFNCITGFYTATSGGIRYRGADITRLPVHRRTALGIARTFQNVGLVKNATVRTNLATAQHLAIDYDPWAGIVGSPGSFAEERRVAERGELILDLLDLRDVIDERVADLPYGLLKRVEIAAVLATDPDLLLLDEPGSGMGPEEARSLGDTLLHLRREFGLTMVLIDHHVPLVTRVSDHVYCLNFGEVLAEGRPDDVRRHPEVVRAYLGEEPDHAAAAAAPTLVDLEPVR
ncbi:MULTISPECIES: ABC transporter ATP-binding protein [unclassified Nocardioides]|uniref:ABC transporter ATP-binding protein n=1 Tax=unclassified Nocardioides TaxID=2615069 RepID=UPI000057084C|nr:MULTISPECIES: ABC transporter ATP-binding protein [unclassified Nocardioides]ABL81620.1 amino acid/amide ABC transporter ATP-binding protein 1, HAAT family [Nocardioides sp. JS614]